MKKRIALSIVMLMSMQQIMANVQAVIFAAGKSSRFEGKTSKLLTPFNGQPMVLYPLQAVANLSIPMVVVVGHQRNMMQTTILEAMPNAHIEFTIQEQQLGTGHALRCARQQLTGEDILLLYGDQPLMKSDTIAKLIKSHEDANAVITIIVSMRTEPGSYGRIVTDEEGITKCVEAKDFVGMDPHKHPRVNSGYYLIKRTFIEEHIDELWMHNNKNEYYINDFIEIASRHGHQINIVKVPYEITHGVNTKEELKLAKALMQKKTKE